MALTCGYAGRHRTEVAASRPAPEMRRVDPAYRRTDNRQGLPPYSWRSVVASVAEQATVLRQMP